VFSFPIARVNRRFRADLDGRLEGDRLTVVEDFFYEDGETNRLTWVFDRAGPGRWTGRREDTVGVAVVEGIKAGTELKAWIMDEDKTITVRAVQDIPIGHKVALKDMSVGDTVFKYGIDIGKVVAAIKAGEHAHVHNIKTKRW
jgi:(2R)-sulfolactate sulfo-lyase subunit alpha